MKKLFSFLIVGLVGFIGNATTTIVDDHRDHDLQECVLKGFANYYQLSTQEIVIEAASKKLELNSYFGLTQNVELINSKSDNHLNLFLQDPVVWKNPNIIFSKRYNFETDANKIYGNSRWRENINVKTKNESHKQEVVNDPECEIRSFKI